MDVGTPTYRPTSHRLVLVAIELVLASISLALASWAWQTMRDMSRETRYQKAEYAVQIKYRSCMAFWTPTSEALGADLSGSQVLVTVQEIPWTVAPGETAPKPHRFAVTERGDGPQGVSPADEFTRRYLASQGCPS